MNETDNYKKYVTCQESLDVNPRELAKGIEDEKSEHHMSDKKAELTAKQHLEEPAQAHYYSGVAKAKKDGMLKEEMTFSPTARPTPIIGVSVRGSSTGGLPSGADQQGDISPTKVGGYDRVQPKNLNSKVVDGTPENIEMEQSNVPINDHPSTSGGITHPHQIQITAHEEPQVATGASTDSDPTLTLKSADSKGIEVDVDEGGESEEEVKNEDNDTARIPTTSLSEGKHKSGCKCGFCMNKTRFGKKTETDEGMGEDEGSDFEEPDEYDIFSARARAEFSRPVKKSKKDTKDEKKPKDEKSLDETFRRHMVLMKEFIGLKEEKTGDGICSACQGSGEGHADGTKCSKCGGSGSSNPKPSKQRHPDADEFEDMEKDKKGGLNESYSAPFARMRSFAGIGDGILLSNGLMELKQEPRATNPSTTHWKMDKEKAGYVKIDEEKLKKVQAMLDRKSKRGSLSETELKLVKRLTEVLKKRQSK